MSGALNRRGIILGAGVLATSAALPRFAHAAPTGPRHGLSSFGELKYGSDFTNFDYVNPMAPRGGRFSTQLVQTFGNQAFDTFDTLNPYVFRGNGAAGLNFTFDSLMVRALDEPDALYGLIARTVETSEDGLSQRFRLRPQAHFHDGSKLTARDVAFSLKVLRDKGHPAIAQELLDLEDATSEADDVVLVRYKPGYARDLPRPWPACRSSRRHGGRAGISRPRRSKRPSAPGPTALGGWMSVGSSSWSACRITGPPSLP